jgi:molybdopterin converting factor small subunit
LNIKLILYGNLRKKVKSNDKVTGNPLKLNIREEDKINIIYDILKKFNLKESEISHIFVNGKYCGLGTRLQDGDRVGIFPKNMGLIFAEIEKNNPIRIRIQLSKNLKKRFHESEAFLRLPKGSNIRYLLNKLNISEDLDNLQIFINESECLDLTYILKEGDYVKIENS